MVKPLADVSERDVRDRLAAIWERILRVEGVTDDSDWFEFSPESRTPLLCDAIAEQWGIKLPEAVVYRDRTVAGLAATIMNGEVASTITQVIPLQDGGEAPCLVYVPGAYGEDLLALQELSTLEYQVYSLRAPGLEEGSEPLMSVADLARHYLSVVEPLVADRPAVLAGYSSGGLTAVEMARLAAGAGYRFRRVVMIDTRLETGPPVDLDDPGMVEDMIEDLVMLRLHSVVTRVAEVSGSVPPDCVGELLTPEKVAEATAYLHEHDAGELPAGVSWSHLARRLRVNAMGLMATWNHQVVPCDVPIDYLRASEGSDMSLDWSEATTSGQYGVIDLEGTHSGMWYGGLVARALGRVLDSERRILDSERTDEAASAARQL